jgi:hypothetical protein
MKAKHTKWTVDECPDANGNFTIRPSDDTPNGNTVDNPIAGILLWCWRKLH